MPETSEQPKATDDEPVLLAHERLDAYRLCLELDELVVRVCAAAPKGHGWLVDQVQRASGSTALNLVEANGRTGADRVHLLKIAKGSVLETDSALDLFVHRHLISSEHRVRAHCLAVRITQMLCGLMRQ
jgi:four helix bundle protein